MNRELFDQRRQEHQDQLQNKIDVYTRAHKEMAKLLDILDEDECEFDDDLASVMDQVEEERDRLMHEKETVAGYSFEEEISDKEYEKWKDGRHEV